MTKRVGVYICHCGSNIAKTVDVAEVARWAAAELDGVVVARDYPFMCSSLGQALVEEDITGLQLDRVVVGSCSPHLHEHTFRKACANAGLNPYLLQLASLREHVSWVHKDKAAATAKAKALIAAAVERVKQQRPLEPSRVPVADRTLVIGGGIAGITASLELANAGHPVTLVEREPSIGGHMAQFDKTFPTLDCAACILTPRMSEVGQHPNIELLAWSELEEVSGAVGGFRARIRRKARYVDEELCTGCGLCETKCPRKTPDDVFEVGMGDRKGIYVPFAQAVPRIPVLDPAHCTWFDNGKCGACQKLCPTDAIDFAQQDRIIERDVGNIVLATGYDAFDARRIPQYGYGRLDNVFTSLELERMCNAAGPTGGRIVLRDGQTEPRSIALVHCVGSRDKNHHPYCSSVCCMAALKFGHLALEKTDAEIYSFYIDIRANSKGYEEFYKRLLDEGMHFIRGKVAEVCDDDRRRGEEGKLIVHVEDTLLGQPRRVPVDMVVLMTALEARRDAREVGVEVGLSCGGAGWYNERHPKLDPVATMTDGIFVAGACQGPKDIPASVAQGAAAAARVGASINRGVVEIEPIVACIDEERCSGCRICNGLCPFDAIGFDDELGRSHVEATLCKGCGTCVAACPAGVITGAHFGDDELRAELRGLLLDAQAA